MIESYAILKEEKGEYQCTVSNTLFFKGIGLHTGKYVSVVIRPAKANSGIMFTRKDIKPNILIKASSDNICSTNLRTSIGSRGVGKIKDSAVLGECISTVEHLMSALWGAGIDNAVIDVYGDEIPAMDGSARVFYEAVYESGIKMLSEYRKYIEILKPIIVSENAESGIEFDDSYNDGGNNIGIAVFPADDFEISYIMDFEHPLVSSGSFNMKIDGYNFHDEISKARTFGFLKDVEYLKKSGLALGGSLDNALVLDETSVLNKEGLRYKDEFIRHKVLDLIGDMYLSGYRIKGRVLARKTGHDMNSKLVKKIGEYLTDDKIKKEYQQSTKDSLRLAGVQNTNITLFA